MADRMHEAAGPCRAMQHNYDAAINIMSRPSLTYDSIRTRVCAKRSQHSFAISACSGPIHKPVTQQSGPQALWQRAEGGAL